MNSGDTARHKAGDDGLAATDREPVHRVTFANEDQHYVIFNNSDSGIVLSPDDVANGYDVLLVGDDDENSNHVTKKIFYNSDAKPGPPILKIQKKIICEEIHENPFLLDGELCQKANFIINNSTISRKRIRIADPDINSIPRPPSASATPALSPLTPPYDCLEALNRLDLGSTSFKGKGEGCLAKLYLVGDSETKDNCDSASCLSSDSSSATNVQLNGGHSSYKSVLENLDLSEKNIFTNNLKNLYTDRVDDKNRSNNSKYHRNDSESKDATERPNKSTVLTRNQIIRLQFLEHGPQVVDPSRHNQQQQQPTLLTVYSNAKDLPGNVETSQNSRDHLNRFDISDRESCPESSSLNAANSNYKSSDVVPSSLTGAVSSSLRCTGMVPSTLTGAVPSSLSCAGEIPSTLTDSLAEISLRDSNFGITNPTDEPSDRLHLREETSDDPLRNISDDPLRNISDDPLRNISDDPLRNISDDPLRNISPTDDIQEGCHPSAEPSNVLPSKSPSPNCLSLEMSSVERPLLANEHMALHHHRSNSSKKVVNKCRHGRVGKCACCSLQ